MFGSLKRFTALSIEHDAVIRRPSARAGGGRGRDRPRYQTLMTMLARWCWKRRRMPGSAPRPIAATRKINDKVREHAAEVLGAAAVESREAEEGKNPCAGRQPEEDVMMLDAAVKMFAEEAGALPFRAGMSRPLAA